MSGLPKMNCPKCKAVMDYNGVFGGEYKFKCGNCRATFFFGFSQFANRRDDRLPTAAEIIGQHAMRIQ